MGVKKWIKYVAAVFGWTIIGVCLPWGIWWYCHIPTPGKGGLLLALVATVMPLVWEDVREIGRAGLILTLVVLFAVEYRAIDKEHKDYAEEQSMAREEERKSFQTLLDEQKTDVSRILEREDQHFKETFDAFLKEDGPREFSLLCSAQQTGSVV